MRLTAACTGVEILNADAHAVEAESAEHEDGVAADFARVDFDGIFAGRYQFEMFADHAEDTFDLFVAQKVGVPPPKCSWASWCRPFRCGASSSISFQDIRCRYRRGFCLW